MNMKATFIIVSSIILLFGSLWGCSASPDNNSDCHHDCFGRLECKKGKVILWEHTPVSCKNWEGKCPSQEVYVCKKGCRQDGKQDFSRESPEVACEEGRPKVVGDSCTSQSDCLPMTSTYDSKTRAVTNVYLKCDVNQKKCVAGEPSKIPGYLSNCNADMSKLLGTGKYGYVEAKNCSGGLCLISSGAKCVPQGCTKACKETYECPQGSVCQKGFSNWSAKPTSHVAGVCKPGPSNIVGIGLTCH